MKATLINVEFNVKLKDKFDGAYLAFKNEQGKSSKEFIFKNSPVYATLNVLAPGDSIEIKKEKSGDFWNIVAVTKLGSVAASASLADIPATPSSGKSTYIPRYTDTPEYAKLRDSNIIKQSTLKVASELALGMLNAGLYKKTTTPELLLSEVERITESLIINIFTDKKPAAKAQAAATTPTDIVFSDNIATVEADDDNDDDIPF